MVRPLQNEDGGIHFQLVTVCFNSEETIINIKKNSVAFSPQVNYTD
jgi:hypothetical protein